MSIRSAWKIQNSLHACFLIAFLWCSSEFQNKQQCASYTSCTVCALYRMFPTIFFWPYSLWKHAGFGRILSSAVQSFCSGSEGQKVMLIINNWRRKNITLASWLMSQPIELASTETVERKVIKTSQMKVRNHIFEKKGFSVIPAGVSGCSEQKNGVLHWQCHCTLFQNRYSWDFTTSFKQGLRRPFVSREQEYQLAHSCFYALLV